jgi:LmbE family N-acetylglucosaminyl deacetylase
MNPRILIRRLIYFTLPRRAYKFALREFVRAKDLDALAEVLACTRQLRAVDPVVMEMPRGRRVLVIAPHEDDEMIGPGGTVTRLVRAGAAVTVLYLTDDSGPRAEARRRETLAVANHVGYATEFLGYPSGTLPVDADSAARLAERIDAHAPDTLLLPFLSDDHPEHRAASRLLYEAARRDLLRARPEVWAYQVYSALLANVAVDITEVAEAKAEAIRMWRDSAMRSRDWAHFALGLNAYNCRLLRGRADPCYVEAFFVVPFDDYAALCARYAGAG